MADLSLKRALAEKALWLGGGAELRRSFPDWLGLSVFAGGSAPVRPDRAEGRTPAIGAPLA